MKLYTKKWYILWCVNYTLKQWCLPIQASLMQQDGLSETYIWAVPLPGTEFRAWVLQIVGNKWANEFNYSFQTCQGFLCLTPLLVIQVMVASLVAQW